MVATLQREDAVRKHGGIADVDSHFEIYISVHKSHIFTLVQPYCIYKDNLSEQ